MEEGEFRDIPSSSVAILLPLLERDGQTLSELCRQACMKAPTITVIANRLEKLRGDRAGQWSIRVNDQWRIVFRWKHNNAHDVRLMDYHS